MKKILLNGKRNWKEIGFLISVFIIPVLNFIVFYVYVNLNSFLLAFQTTTAGTTIWGFENFKIIFSRFSVSDNGELLIALKNTGIWCGFNIFIYLPSMLTTYFIYKKVRGNKFIAFMSMLPGLLPASAYVGFVKYILAPNGVYGYLSENLLNELAIPLLQDSRYATKTMLCYSLWLGIGINFLWSGAMNGISYEILEAGKIDGTTWWSELVKIIIPLIWPTLSVSLIFTAAGLLGSTGPVLVFTEGKYSTSTLSFWIFAQVQYSNNYELPAAMGFLMSAISIPLVFIVRHYAEKVEVY